MAQADGNTLGEYVKQIMREKNLSQRDVRLKSGGRITDSYVSGIINGNATNLTVEKLKALASGLGVDELEMARVAFGLRHKGPARQRDDAINSFVLLDLKKKVVMGLDIAEIVQEVLRLSPGQRAVVLQYVKRLNASYEKARRNKGSV